MRRQSVQREGQITDHQVQRSLQALDSQLRRILLWHVNDGLTYRDIARRLGVPPQDALRQLARAYATLSVLMQTVEGAASVHRPSQMGITRIGAVGMGSGRHPV